MNKGKMMIKPSIKPPSSEDDMSEEESITDEDGWDLMKIIRFLCYNIALYKLLIFKNVIKKFNS